MADTGQSILGLHLKKQIDKILYHLYKYLRD